MPTNPIYNNLDPAWYDFRNQGEAVTFKPGFAREADAGEKINNETADAGDLVITNAGGRTFRVSDEIEKKRWKLDGEKPQTYMERGKLVSGHVATYAGPPVMAVKAGESGFLPAPKEWQGHSGWMLLPEDRIVRDQLPGKEPVFYAMQKRQFEAATESWTPPAPKAEPPPRRFGMTG